MDTACLHSKSEYFYFDQFFRAYKSFQQCTWLMDILAYDAFCTE